MAWDDRYATTDDPTRRSTAEGSASAGSSSVGPSLAGFLDRIRAVLPEALDDADVDAARIGRFPILGELGRGTFGVVLLALDPHLRCKRAVKIPTARVADDPAARAKFLDDARLAASIDHPNVVRVLEADEFGDLCYFVMEYCAEGSLSEWLKKRPADRPIDPRWAARFVAEIADGVQAAHAKKILHRDLKPANILLVRVGEGDEFDPRSYRPKVADFGLAKSLGEPGDVEASIDGQAVGTLPYMSPEQARGDRKAISEASDVYALGAILFELLTGRRVYPGDDRGEVFAGVVGDDPPPSPRSVRADVPRELEILCNACLAKEPGDRYPSAAMLAEDLRRYANGEPVRGTPIGRRVRAAARRHRAALWAASAALVVLASGLAWMAWLARASAAEVWVAKVRESGVEGLPALAREQNPPGPRVRGPLAAMFRSRDRDPKRSAAVMLAGLEPECADHACEVLLTAPPEEVGAMARALEARRMPRLVERLEDAAAAPGTEEIGHARRSNAAAALAVLGRPGPGLAAMKADPDPQTRTFLIHALGPAGVTPRALFHLLRAEKDACVRMALILAIGEIPDAGWADQDALRLDVANQLLTLYRDDKDPGVHGAAKWLLGRWLMARERAEADEELMLRRDDSFGWRIHPSGLTLVRVDLEDGRAFEVSDTEVPRKLFLEFKAGHEFEPNFSPSDDAPISSINLLDAAPFLNWLSDRDPAVGVRGRAYEPGADGLPRPVEGRPGYRLPDDREFTLCCRAGAGTRFHYGDSEASLPLYAWFVKNTDGRARPVALLKPNDLGLFDTLGNLFEVCRAADRPPGHPQPMAYRGGGLGFPAADLACDWRIGDITPGEPFKFNVSFRVARTVR